MASTGRRIIKAGMGRPVGDGGCIQRGRCPMLSTIVGMQACLHEQRTQAEPRESCVMSKGCCQLHVPLRISYRALGCPQLTQQGERVTRRSLPTRVG